MKLLLNKSIVVPSMILLGIIASASGYWLHAAVLGMIALIIVGHNLIQKRRSQTEEHSIEFGSTVSTELSEGEGTVIIGALSLLIASAASSFILMAAY